MLDHYLFEMPVDPFTGPTPGTKAIQGSCTVASSRRYWTTQLKFLCTLAFSQYDRALLHPGETSS